jgi:hypothetical protein
MAGYNEIRGLRVKYLSADPANAENGQVWYNSTTGTLRSQGIGTGAFISQVNFPRSSRDASGFGTTTAGVIFGGTLPPGAGGPGRTDAVDEWDGNGFSTATALPTGLNGLDSDGPQTAGLTAGGNTPGSPVSTNTASFDYNGTAWTANPTLNVQRTGHATVGNTAAQTAAIAIGGEPSPAAATTSDWNGSSWTAGAAAPGWAQGTSGGGTTSAAFVNANVNDGDATLNYDGSTWSSGSNSNTQHNYGGAGGTQASGVTFGGTPVGGPTVRQGSELYDGTTWTTSANMAAGVSNAHGKCTVNGRSFLVATGNPGPPGFGNTTEQFDFGTSSFTAAAWSSGGAYPVTIQSGAGFGTQTAAVGAGGTPPGNVGLKTFEYDGNSWTAGNDMSRTPTGSPYLSAYISGSGILTAGWAAAGGYPTAVNNVENYDGTNWTASAALPSPRGSGNSSGPQTAGLYFGGNTGSPPRPVVATTFEYDGEAWTSGGDLNTARTNAAGSGPTGSQTAALCFTGNTPSQTNKTEEYNGTAWTEVNVFPRSASYLGYSGTQTDAVGFTGYTSPGAPVTTTTGYDGTSWATRPNMATARLMYHTNAGTGSSALAFGGEATTGVVSVVEEWDSTSSTTAPAATITTS